MYKLHAVGIRGHMVPTGFINRSVGICGKNVQTTSYCQDGRLFVFAIIIMLRLITYTNRASLKSISFACKG